MQKGILKNWNDDKGFGFIRPENGSGDIFLHISSLHGFNRRPVVGDVVYFSVVHDENGRNRAGNVSIEGAKSIFKENMDSRRTANTRVKMDSKTNIHRSRHVNHPGFFAKCLNLVMILTLIGLISFFYDKKQSSNPIKSEPELEPVMEIQKSEQQFVCAGKTRCGQMTSCQEAMFYLDNCPGTLTDGDGDGRPCEDQWCGH